MGIFADLKKGFEVMLRPTENTKANMEIGAAYSWYYRATLIPLIVLIIVALILASAFAASPIFSIIGSSFAGLGIVAAIVVPILFVWVLIPISIFINAGLYHIIGQWTGTFKGDFNKTLTAVMFSQMPTTIFLFSLIIPATAAFFVLFIVWDLIVLLLALANQQKMKWNIALGVVIVTVVIVSAVVGLIVTVFAITVQTALVNAILPHILGSGGYNVLGLPFSPPTTT